MARVTKLTDQEVCRIVSALKQGIPLGRLRDQYNVGPVTMRNTLRRAGHEELLKEVMKPRGITPELIATAQEKMATGMSQAEAARSIGFSPQGLCNALKRRGSPATGKSLRAQPKDSEIARRPDMQSHIDLNNRFLCMPLRVSL